ncbi:MAG TPA: hypothetical protein VKV24_06570 [Casimicrobiaceae bacterium]|nr:hypothetical protein [Casimicrobiaceae bacterium]
MREDLGATVVFAQDEVDDAADRVAAIDRGCAVCEHLDMVDRRERNRVQVDAAGSERVRRHTATVEQRDGELVTQSAQSAAREPRGVRATLESLRLVERAEARRRRYSFDELRGGLEIRPLDFVASDDPKR